MIDVEQGRAKHRVVCNIISASNPRAGAVGTYVIYNQHTTINSLALNLVNKRQGCIWVEMEHRILDKLPPRRCLMLQVGTFKDIVGSLQSLGKLSSSLESLSEANEQITGSLEGLYGRL